MDIELEKDKKNTFFEDKVEIPDSKVIDEMIRLDSNRISSKEKK